MVSWRWGRLIFSHNNPFFVAEREWGAMPVGGGAVVMREIATSRTL